MKSEVVTCVKYVWKATQAIDWEQQLLLGRSGWGCAYILCLIV